MHRCGAIVLERLLEFEDGSCLDRSCECGGAFKNKKKKKKWVRTILGRVRVERIIQRCDGCGAGRAAEDVVLDIVGVGYSPGLRRIMALTGAEVSFDKARDLIGVLSGMTVTDKDVERFAEGIGGDIAVREEKMISEAMRGKAPEPVESPSTLYIGTDGTGVPVLKKETEGRKGKADDGVARTREVKLGVVFTQTAVNEKGDPVRDPASTSYTAKIESVETFGPRLYAEALRRGLEKAGRVVIIGDGAPWIWNLADDHFPGSVRIVDFYHAKEHLGELARTLFPDDGEKRKNWRKEVVDDLWEGRLDEVLGKLRSLKVRGKKKELRDRKIEYFGNNRERMRYGEFRKAGLFIGSGVVEAGCKSVIAQRLKQSGMRWSVRGANSIIALRCCMESGRLEEYWEERRAA